MIYRISLTLRQLYLRVAYSITRRSLWWGSRVCLVKFRLDKDSFLWLLLDPVKGCPVIEINHSQKLPEKFKLSNFSLLEEASVIRERKRRCQYALPRSSWIKNTKFNYPCVPVLSSNCDQLKDILVKSCTLQKAKLTLTCIKFVAGRRTTASYMSYLLHFIAYTADLMQASKVFYPAVAPW